MVRKGSWLAVGVALLALSATVAACGPGRPPYAPNEKVVASLGEEAAKLKLAKLLSQAAAPQVNADSVDVGHDSYFYQALDLAMFGRGLVSQKVFFKDVQKAEVWGDDGRYYCRLLGEEDKLDQLRWTTEAEAKEFADLVFSFKANLSAPATAAPPPAPEPAPAPSGAPSAAPAPSATPDKV